MESTIRVTLPLTITDEDIDDIMSSALDWISYWCERVEVVGDYLGEYASEQISRGGELRFYPIEEITDNDPDYFVLDRTKLITALRSWVSDYGSYVGNIIEEGRILLDTGNIDGPCADSIIQLALFGEKVFA